MNAIAGPPLVRWTRRLEEATVLDAPVRALDSPVRALFATGAPASLLRGDWLGHAVHPVLTDVVIGTWSSASLLDVFGARQSAASAQRLVGIGLIAAGPTAWTGWAEWSAAGSHEQRVGVVHAATNGLAIGLYFASWVARQRGRRKAGIRLGLVGAGVLGIGAYLGGHLAAARKVGSHHSAFD